MTQLEGEDYEEWKKGVMNIQKILKDNLEIVAGKEAVKELEEMKYDIMMLDPKVQNGVALVMEKAFWDHIITEMNLNNYKSFIGLFYELSELLKELISYNSDLCKNIDDSIKLDLQNNDIQGLYW